MKTLLISLVVLSALTGCSKDDTVTPSLGTIRGKTVDARTLKLIGSVEISTIPASSTLFTDVSGTYQINDVVPGAYLISAHYADSAFGESTAHVIAGHIIQADIVLEFSPPTTGSVVGSVKDALGSPISDATIVTSPTTITTKSADDGTFILTSLEPSDYTLTVRKDRFFGEILIHLVAGKTIKADIIMHEQDLSMGWISGQVVRSGETVPNIIVELYGDNLRDTTDITGTFHFANVSPGTTAISLIDTDASARVHTLFVNPGKGSILRVDLGFPQDIPKADLVAYYALNGSGADYGPNGLSGVIIGSPFVNDRHGRLNSALQTSGNTNEGLIVEHSEKMNVLPITLAAWIRIDDPLRANCLILGKNLHPSGDGYFFTLENNYLVAMYITNGYSTGFRLDLQISSAQWVHVAMSVSPTNGIAYVNGNSANMKKVGAGATRVSTEAQFRLGSHETLILDVPGFIGAIDDVFVYNRILNAQEINALMNIKF